MINNEFELMQASADAEEEAQALLKTFQQEWLGKRGKVNAPMPQPQQPPMQAPPMPQVNYG